MATRPGTGPAIPGTRPATRRRRWLVMNETAAPGEVMYVMYADEGRRPPSLFGEHCEILLSLRKTLKRWWRRLEKRRMATESGGDETGVETSGPGGSGDETEDKTAATGGGIMYMDEGELEFDEDEMAALEGQRNLLDALGGLTTFHHRSSYECSNCKEGSVHLTLTTIFCRCQQTVQLPTVPKPIQLKQTTSPKTAKKCFKGNYITTMYFVLCIVCCVGIVCCVVYCLLCITVLCCANNQKQILQQNLIFFHINKKLCKLLIFFSSDVGFSMSFSVRLI